MFPTENNPIAVADINNNLWETCDPGDDKEEKRYNTQVLERYL